MSQVSYAKFHNNYTFTSNYKAQRIHFLSSLIESETPKITRRNEIILAITLVIAVIAIVFVYFL